MANYYPLALQNEWHYQKHDGSAYTNKIINASCSQFTMHNSATNTSSIVKTDGHLITTDVMEPGNFQPWLTNALTKEDNWVVKFKAHDVDGICVLIMTVKATGISKEVAGKIYTNVLCIEAENKIIVNDSFISLNFFTQYYYAEGVGLILITSSAGDCHALTGYSLY